MYYNIIEKHLIALDGVKLQDIGRIHLQVVLNNASGKERTCQQIQMVFFQILKSAVVDRLFPASVYETIRQNADSIKYKPNEKRPLTETEKRRYSPQNTVTNPTRYLHICYTAVGCAEKSALRLLCLTLTLQTARLVSVGRMSL